MSASARYALGIDVGGTHTDIELVAIEGDASFRHKIASTPDDPARAVTARLVRAATAWSPSRRSCNRTVVWRQPTMPPCFRRGRWHQVPQRE